MDRSFANCRVARWAAALVVACLAIPGALPAAKVVLRIHAGNRADEPRTVQIKSSLPDRISTNDILDRAGLDLGYDVKSDTYYVHGEIELGPKETRILDVEMKDIWRVSEEELDRLVRRGGQLVEMLDENEAYRETAVALRSEIMETAEAIRAAQSENRIGRPNVSPLQHIRAYETNLKRLTQVRKNVGSIENLVLASGKDPGALVGQAQDVPPPRPAGLAPDEYDTATIRITIRNTSPTRARENQRIRRDLPREILPGDVIDADGLEVARDTKRGVTYVFKNGLTIAPNETLTFDVKIRDKWNVNDARVKGLVERIDNIAGQIGEGEQYASIDESLQQLRDRLTAIRNETEPEEIGSDYVAFYREQAERLDEIEKGIYRTEAALRPVEKRQKKGFRIQPPSIKTTWLIIYIILGFLAVVSLLFLLRWMGKSKAERMEE